MEKILVLGAGEYQVRVIEELKGMGLHVIAVDGDSQAAGQAVADEFLPLDIVNKDKVFRLADSRQVSAIMPVNDFGVRSAAFASQRLGLIGLPPEAAEFSNHKGLMRQRWANSDLRQPGFRVVRSFEECRQAGSELGYPLVIKPTDCGGGSRGVRKVANQALLQEAFEAARTFATLSDDIIIEQLIPGLEITIEGFVYRGRVQVLAISDKEHFHSDTYCVASGLNYYAALPEHIIKNISDLAERAAKALDFDNCPFHMEMIINDQKSYLVEISARAGGGCIFSTIVNWVSGVNFVRQYAGILMGRVIDIKPRYRRGAVFRFLSAPKGRISDIRNYQEAGLIEGVAELKIFKNIGETVGDVSMDNERLGFMVTLGENRKEALKMADEAEALLEIKI